MLVHATRLFSLLATPNYRNSPSSQSEDRECGTCCDLSVLRNWPILFKAKHTEALTLRHSRFSLLLR
ncbi:unnamed protein product [Chondrus crispus]|uniref:Uncharacterized protein n=1 Tax=Chondrus crispus TaxID=2769 RepID=R7QP20_CHOCR|nr:unnamed protein product [Chondrus crispus]CDF39503.1 unnamed protein product [Chondrus crispus]|eukprot:XP_005719414.1 unnamed protein product [Chondrus crispus]